MNASVRKHTLNAVFILTTLFTAASLADILSAHSGNPLSSEGFFKLDEVPPLYPVALFKTDGKPAIHFLLAQGQDRNTYVVMRDQFGLRVPKLDPRSMSYFDGGLFSGGRGSADLYFEIGGRLLLPSSQKQNYLNATQGNTLYSKGRAPMSLVELSNLSPSRLKALSFDRFIAKKEERKATSPRKKELALTTQKGAKFTLLEVVDASDDFQTNYSTRRAIRDFGEKIDASKAAVLESTLVGSELRANALSMLLVKRDSVNDMKAALAEVKAGEIREVDFSTVREILDLGPPQAKVNPSEALANIEKPSKNKKLNFEALVRSIVLLSGQNANFWNKIKNERSNEDVVQLIREVAQVLGRLESMHMALQHQMLVDARIEAGDQLNFVKEMGEVRNNPLQLQMVQPLERTALGLLTILDRMNHPEAQKVIFVATPIMNGVGQRIFGEKAMGTNKTYSQLYFEYLRSAHNVGLNHLMSGDFLNRGGTHFQVSSSSGGLFDQVFKSVGGQMTEVKDFRPGQSLYLDRLILSPLVNLGREDRRQAMVQSVMQTVIDFDKEAEFLAQWTRIKGALYKLQNVGLDRAAGLEFIDQGFLSNPTIERIFPRFSQITGVEDRSRVNQIVRSSVGREASEKDIFGSSKLLSFVLAVASGFIRESVAYPGFSSLTYQKATVEIFTKLMEASSVSFINEGTYISVLEGAIRISRHLQAHPEEVADSELEASLRRMNTVIQNQLLRGFDHERAVKNSINVAAAPKYEFKVLRPVLYTCVHLFER